MISCNDCSQLDFCLERADWEDDKDWWEKNQTSQDCPYRSQWTDYEAID